MIKRTDLFSIKCNICKLISKEKLYLCSCNDYSQKIIAFQVLRFIFIELQSIGTRRDDYRSILPLGWRGIYIRSGVAMWINQTSPPHIPYRIINVCIELICDLLCFIFNRTLNDSYVDSLGIRMLPNFADPYHHR